MGEVSTIGVDLAKSVFQVHGSDAAGAVLFRRKLRRHQVLAFFAAQPPCTVRHLSLIGVRDRDRAGWREAGPHKEVPG